MKGFDYYLIRDSEGIHYGLAYELDTAIAYATHMESKYGKWGFHVEKEEIRQKKINEQLSLF